MNSGVKAGWKIGVVVGISACLDFSDCLSAAVIAGWDVSAVDLNASGASGIDGNSTLSPYTFSAGVMDGNLQSAQLSLSSSVNSSTTGGQYGFKISGGSEQSSLAGAVASGHYIQFSLQVKPGYRLDLTSIEMSGESSGTGADNVALLSSVDGFSDTSSIASLGSIAGDAGGFDTDSSGFGAPISLVGSNFQNLSNVNFRIYGWNTSSSSGITYIRNLSGNDLVVNGQINAVPEPSYFLSGVCVVSMSLLLRRRSRSWDL